VYKEKPATPECTTQNGFVERPYTRDSSTHGTVVEAQWPSLFVFFFVPGARVTEFQTSFVA